MRNLPPTQGVRYSQTHGDLSFQVQVAKSRASENKRENVRISHTTYAEIHSQSRKVSLAFTDMIIMRGWSVIEQACITLYVL